MERQNKEPRTIEILSPGGGGWPDDQYYVWGYQPHFAISFKIAAERLFKQLDDQLNPDVFLIGVRTDEKRQSPSIVIEPKDHDFQPDLFSDVLDLVDSSFKIDPGTAFACSEDSLHGKTWARERERGQDLNRVRQTIRQIIERRYTGHGPLVYLSSGREFDSYVVYGALLLQRQAYESHTHLNISHRDEFAIHTSLIDATASCFMDACWEALPQSGAGDCYVSFPTNEALLKKAGDLLMHSASYPCDNMEGLHGVFQLCNTIATLTYERSDSKGTLILSRKHHPNVEQTLVLTDPRSVQNFRAVRKLLQLPKSDEALLCDSAEIYGIGRISDGYDPTDEDLFCIEFVGHAKWQLVHAGVPLMRVEYGVPSLPAGRRQAERFSETFQRLFPGATAESVKVISQVAVAATRLHHGTILVIAADAEQESERFGVQSTRITPTLLNEEILSMGSRIDGALLTSPDGVCHAIGVILDGDSNDRGSAERGARFNSAVRYVYGREVPCLALVISDDGMIDSVPQYRPRASRREIENHLREFKEIVGSETVNQRAMNKKTRWLSEHRFYLSESQCDEINKLFEEAEPKRDASASLVTYGAFKPHPDMDDSLLTE